jgi:hypothetical protein
MPQLPEGRYGNVRTKLMPLAFVTNIEKEKGRKRMLHIYLHNNGTTDTPTTGNYDYLVFINKNQVGQGEILNHRRGDWRDLIIQWGEQLEKEKAEEIAKTIAELGGI